MTVERERRKQIELLVRKEKEHYLLGDGRAIRKMMCSRIILGFLGLMTDWCNRDRDCRKNFYGGKSQVRSFFLKTAHWKVWCWSWNSSSLATWCEELTPWKRPWCWERLKAGGEGDDRGRIGDGQGGLTCCSPWGRKASDRPERRSSSCVPSPCCFLVFSFCWSSVLSLFLWF